MVHLHVRDYEGNLTKDLLTYGATILGIRRDSSIILQASTGGVSDLDIRQRCAPLFLYSTEATTLNCGSVNLGDAVYQNPLPDVRYCAEICFQQEKLPEVEVFELGMLHTLEVLRQQQPFAQPLWVNIVLGHSLPATVEYLTVMRRFLPPDCLWGVTHYGREGDFSLLAAAVAMGAHLVRVGFEDSAALEEGVLARFNYELVEKMAELIRALGRAPATPMQAREILGLMKVKDWDVRELVAMNAKKKEESL
jgi:3-keto-5-aminohexanoate cleavage enzyme